MIVRNTSTAAVATRVRYLPETKTGNWANYLCQARWASILLWYSNNTNKKNLISNFLFARLIFNFGVIILKM